MTTPPPLPNPPRRSRKWLPLTIIAAIVLSLFILYLQLKPQWDEARTHVEERSKFLSARNNLIQIAAAADTYFLQEPAKDQVTVPELKEWLGGVLLLKPVEGEDYNSVVIRRDWRSISVQLPSGATVEWKKE